MKLLKNNKGTSIVSVMVAFLILLLGISMMYTSITLSQNMVNTAAARLDRNNADMGKYYRQRSTESSDEELGMYKILSNQTFESSPSFNVQGVFEKEEDSGYYYFR